MRKFLSLVVVFILSYITLAVAVLQGWQSVKVIAMIFAVAVTLAIILEIVKLIGFFISSSISSILYCLVALGLVGVLSFYGEIPALAAYLAGAGFSVASFLLIFRKLARVAQKSVVFGEVFQLVSAYRIRSYFEGDSLIEKETKINIDVDSKNVYVLLTEQMGFPKKVAREATIHALSGLSADTPIEEKVKSALKYLNDPDYFSELATGRN